MIKDIRLVLAKLRDKGQTNQMISKATDIPVRTLQAYRTEERETVYLAHERLALLRGMLDKLES